LEKVRGSRRQEEREEGGETRVNGSSKHQARKIIDLRRDSGKDMGENYSSPIIDFIANYITIYSVDNYIIIFFIANYIIFLSLLLIL
jgi:hypothetical protein